jgi:hypothetical protein
MTRRELMEFCDRTDYFDRAEVIRLIDRKEGSKVWYLLNFALWWKHCIGG